MRRREGLDLLRHGVSAVDCLHTDARGMRVLFPARQLLHPDNFYADKILTLLQLEYPVLVLVFVVSTVTGLVVSTTWLVV